jgi:spermidine/putrescine-binding protein
MLANARALEARSGDALRQIRTGAALAGFAVNTDGLALAAASGGAIRYFDPPGATAATPDVISVLANGENGDLADAFVAYVLSEEGQTLWGVRGDARQPAGRSLYHYPIAEIVYEQYADHLCVERNPLKEDFGLRYDPAAAERLGRLVQHLVAAACGQNHIPLQLTWRRVIDAGLPPAALAELTAPLFDEATAMSISDQLNSPENGDVSALVAEWSGQFAEKYRRAAELAGR